jgi:amino-acid N-acetyltransferase
MAPRRAGRRSAEPFGEKEFYLEEFRGRTMLFVVDPSVADSRVGLDDLARTIRELVRNRTRVLELPALPRSNAALQAALAEAWLRVRRGGFCMLTVASDTAAALRAAAGVAAAKVVIVHRAGGLRTSGGMLSFVDESVLETVLRQGEAEWAGLGAHRQLLRAVRDAIDAGVQSVNLCGPRGVAQELFTYVGSGTLFTEGDYSHVERLRMDLYRQAEVMIRRGEREGMLKRRTIGEIAELLAGGYGAVLGGRHLAGVAALLTARYVGTGLGELAALYTITRFQGEGLGRRLVVRVMEDAAAAGLEAVFACTVDRRAQAFFVQQGFERISPQELPAAKWHGYDPRRARRVACFRRAC